jgi:protein-disulfide isomerase
MTFRFIKSSALISALLISLLFHTQINAQALTADQLLKQLEVSGALDRAVQKSLERIRQKNIAAQRLEEEKIEKQKVELAKNARQVDPKSEFIYGNINATVSIIEYSDFECPYCQKFSAIPLTLADEMPNHVNVVWRNFPLPFHNPMAVIEASAGICIGKLGGNDAFWKYADAVFSSSKLNGQGMPVENGIDPTLKLAKSLGVSPEQFEGCMSSESTQKQINSDLQDGVSAGINGTPGVILVNHQSGRVDILAGAVSLEVLRGAVQNLLAK